MSPEDNKPNSEYVGSIKAYTAGFVTSLIITLLAYWLVVNQLMSGWSLAIVIIVLAIVQCYIQLIFFLHLDKSNGPKWRLGTFLFTLAIVIVIGGGSLWIMHSLNGRMVDTQDMIEYMNKEQGL